MSADKNRPRYWVCIFGPVPDSKVPPGADSLPRLAARHTARHMTGCDAPCASAWVEEKTAAAMRKAMRR